MVQLFIFFSHGELVAVSEGLENALLEEKHLTKTTNGVEVISVLGPTFDICWDNLQFKLFRNVI